MSIPHKQFSKITFSSYVSLFIGHKANCELLKLDLPAKAKVRAFTTESRSLLFLYNLTPPSNLILIGLNFIGNDFQRCGGS